MYYFYLPGTSTGRPQKAIGVEWVFLTRLFWDAIDTQYQEVFHARAQHYQPSNWTPILAKVESNMKYYQLKKDVIIT
jgi:hypothetical protein